jgi:hypothetical protein
MWISSSSFSLLPELLVRRGKWKRRVRTHIPLCINAGPEVGWSVTLRNCVGNRFHSMPQVSGNRPQLLVSHVTPARPGHRRGKIVRIEGEISLTRSHRCDFHVGRVFRAQSITERIENLPLAEPPETCGVVRSQVSRPRDITWFCGGIIKGAGADMKGLRRTHQAREPPRSPRIVLPTMTAPAVMTENELSAEENLFARALSHLNAGATRRSWSRARAGSNYEPR